MHLEERSFVLINCIGMYKLCCCNDIIIRFVTLEKERNPNIVSTHCFINRDVKKWLFNFLKRKPVYSVIFVKLCENVDKEQSWNLLPHIEMQWLSRSRVFNRGFELKEISASF